MSSSPVLPLDLSFGQGSDDTQLLKSELLSCDTTNETQATLDTSLQHSPLPKVMDQPDQKVGAEHLDMKLKCTVRVKLMKLDLKVGQTVKGNASCQQEPNTGIDDQDLVSTTIYDTGDIPTLTVSHIPEWYKKPKYKLPSSVKSPNAKHHANFRVKVHGIKCR